MRLRLHLFFLAALLLPAAAFPLTATPRTPPQPAADGVLERFEVPRAEDGLYLPVTLKGKSYLFVLDTGATHTLFDSSLPLGEPLGFAEARTPGGPTKVRVMKAPEARVGKLGLDLAGPVASLDLSRVRHVSGQPIYGLLGMDFLARHVVRLDFENDVVSFHRSAGKTPGVRVALHDGKSNPALTAQIAGFGQTQFLIDTGMIGLDSGDLRTDVYDHLSEELKIAPLGQALAESLAGTRKSRVGAVDSLSVAAFTHRDLKFGEGHRNVLSLGYLSRYTVTFDFPAEVMYLQKARGHADPDRRDLSGLHLLRIAEKTVVDSVERGSAGEAAGVRAKDELMGLGGSKAASLTLQRVRRHLAEESLGLPVVLRRGGETVEASLVLRKRR